MVKSGLVKIFFRFLHAEATDKACIPSIFIKTAQMFLVKADINHHFLSLLLISLSFRFSVHEAPEPIMQLANSITISFFLQKMFLYKKMDPGGYG